MKTLTVDASCLGNPGVMEYRCVDLDTKKEVFRRGPYQDATNNIGEFLALVHALALLKKHQKHDVVVYSDSVTAIAWVRNKMAKTTLTPTKNNAVVIDLVKRAEKWLIENEYKNPVLKWDTKTRGEIPADFGRK
jgi:ribonuclease HI